MMTGKDEQIAFLRLLPSKTVANGHAYHRLSLTESIVLGRDFRCQIVLDPALYRSVSRRHAEVSPVMGIEMPSGNRFWQICDLSSSNGTYLNGIRLIGCRVLQSGDRISLGQHGPEFVFEYQLQEESESPPSFKFRSSPIPDSADPTTPPPPRSPLVASRPRETVSLTQLFPILSTGRELAHKAYLLPAGITVLFVVLLFLAIGNPTVFNFLLASYLAIAAYFFIYQLCGKRKLWWLLLLVALATALLLVSPVLDLFTLVFHRLLPGDLSNTDAQTNFLIVLVKMFFGAGLMEELFKAMPVLFLYWLGFQLRSPWREKLGVWEPLDGILLGAASAVGFSLMETLGVYVPATYKSALMSGPDAAQLASLQLLIPRVLGLVAGHMAYSGYLGYFIGLSALRRRQRKLILGVGYGSAAGLHTLWNAAGLLNPAFLAIVGGLSYAFLGAAILKARALSPTRSQNFATRFYQ